MRQATRLIAALLAVFGLAIAGACSGGGDKADITGSWVLTGGSIDGETITAEDLSMLDEMGLSTSLMLNEDKTASLNFAGEEMPGAWEEADGGAKITFDGAAEEGIDPMLAKLNGDELTLDFMGDSLIFKRGDPPEASAAVEEESDAAETTDEEGEMDMPSGPSQAVAFGDTYTWDDGLAVTISAPTEFTVSEFWAEDFDLEANTPLYFEITVTNGTTEPFDPFMADANVLSGGKQAETVFSGEDVDLDTPTVQLLPGKSISYNVGFVVADVDDLQFSWGDWDRDPVFFAN